MGYDYVDRVLIGDFTAKTVALLAVMKIIATPAVIPPAMQAESSGRVSLSAP